MITIEQTRPNDYKALFDISKVTLGENYLKADDFYEYALVYSAKIDERIVGFLTARAALPSDYSNFSELKQYESKDAMYISTVAVHPDFQHQGIGTQLMEKIISNATQKVVFFTAWETKSKKVNIEKTALKLGFDRRQVLPRYWSLKSVGKKNYCIDCGSPCSCNAVVFARNRKH